MSQLKDDTPSDEKPGPLFPTWGWGGAIAIIALAIMIGTLLFNPISADLTCVRYQPSSTEDLSQPSVDCELVRHTALQTMSPIKIVGAISHGLCFAIAADIHEHRTKGAQVSSYTVDIRASNRSYTFPLLYSRDFHAIRQAKQEVNDFLLHSDAPSFSAHFPKAD